MNIYIINAMRQRARADNNHIDVSFSCVCLVMDNEFRHNVAKVVRWSTATPSMLWCNPWSMINNTTDAWQSDSNLTSIHSTNLHKEVLGRATAHLPFPSKTASRLCYVGRRSASPGVRTNYPWMSWWYFGTRVPGSHAHIRRWSP